MAEFLTDIQTLRDRARAEMDKGPVTQAYGADLPRVVQVCNEALATEIVCVLRYKRHYYTATGIHAEPVAAEFAEHAADEQRHADLLADRISQLGGEPDFDPARLSTRAHTHYDGSLDLIEMIKEDLVAERVAIASYTEIAQWLGDGDPTTRRLFEVLLADEEDHADDLANLLQRLPAEAGGRREI
ncbi:bacterioferritin [Sphaerisporangium siamense]|uniref:Bacterioferritin n=1 Tax=Sphaerisporangium siamense TaxID=795645 RepID=A0A7W7GEE1_9ACTN|nr:ferritin-like domain-containing protein [Sphaerisporangium siamense]MBB4703946.1 bacterioferritin [Sphaerisporangium siamense]GII82417.1 bacterioferritin [Sphaerisporangium siamense]